MNLGLEGKVALVTGGARDVGRAITCRADVAEYGEVQTMIERVVGRRGGAWVDYACNGYYVCLDIRPPEVTMACATVLKRKSFFVDETALRRARRALGVGTDAEFVRLAVERVTEMERFWRFMKRTRRAVKPGSFTCA